ncbi:MAG: 50S ribosomal protein L1 [Chthonomonas sp.]|nr:50S ribosomal protein L1 [Chthonomonas sp.]
MRNKTRHSARYSEVAKTIEKDALHGVEEAIVAAKKNANAKFVESIDISVRLGIDSRKSDQNVRGITTLPHGTGKKAVVWVLAKGDLAKEAEAAGADFVGADELITKIQGGEKNFTVVLATDEMAPQIGKIGKALGAKTPNKRNGTVTNSIAQAVKELKSGARVEYRADKGGVVHCSIGRANFSDDQLQENFKAALTAIVKAKPASSKGKYLLSITVTSTMGTGVGVDPSIAQKFAGVA